MNNLDRSKIWSPYILWTMGISYTLWFAIVIGQRFGLFQFGTPLMMTMYILGANTTTIMAFILIIRSRQRTFKELFKESFAFKQPPIYYLIVVVLPILFSVITLLQNQASIVGPFYAPLFTLPVMVLFGGGLEEIGWRHILQPALEQKIGFIPATIVTGAIWAVWHLPLFFIIGANQNTQNFGAFAVWVMGMAFVLAMLYRLSNSVWLCILCHSLSNAMGDFILSKSVDIPSSIVLALVMIAISLILLRVIPGKEK